MKFFISRAIALILSLLACNTSKAQPALENTDNKSLLWRISSKDMKKSSYLFGTMHLICKDDYLWTPVMARSLKSTEEVCFEMDMDDPSLLLETATGMIDNSGKTLKDYFTKEQYQKLERYISDSLQMDIAMFQQMKPAALQTMFAVKAVDCTLPVSYESNIMEDAKQQQKRITGIEEAREQLALFDSIAIDTVIKDIVDMIDNRADDRKEYREMVLAYKQQDIPKLYSIIEGSKLSGDNLDAFLDQRNQKWIERMVEKMDQSSIFFAVGAGHLWGDNGLITLLRKAGYAVTPVK